MSYTKEQLEAMGLKMPVAVIGEEKPISHFAELVAMGLDKQQDP